jgi:hypothetical protein
MLHRKIMHAMSERDEGYVLYGKVQIDDAYLGGECPVGKAGRGSENKVPIVAAISLNAEGYPNPCQNFTSHWVHIRGPV